MTNIVWSKNGVLAYARNHTVYFTWPERISGSCWKLIKPVEINVGRKVAFLSFGPYFDLAVVDDTGRIEIIEILPGGKYKIKASWLSVADPRSRPAELDKVVRVYWLNNDKSLGLPTSVPKVTKPQPGQAPQNTKAVWDSVKPTGPLHPVHGKTCLLAVTGNGMLRVIIEVTDGFREVSAALPTNLAVSAVAFCTFPPDALLMAAYCEHEVLLFQIKIVFPANLMDIKQAPDPVAEINIQPIAAATVTQPLLGELSVFELIKSPMMPQARPIVHAIFNVAESSQVLIFKLIPWNEKLHPALQRFQTTNKEETERWKLNLSDSRTTQKAVKSYYMSRTAIIIVYKDNSIESQNLLSIPMLLPGRELAFTGVNTSLDMCFSPNLCILAQLPANDGEEPELRLLSSDTYPGDKLSDLPTIISTTYAFSVYNYIHCDDLHQVIWRWIHVDLPKRNLNVQVFINLLASESQRLLNVPFNPSDDPRQADKFIVIPSSLQRWLMLQMEVGTDKNWKRTPSSLMAWMGLNIQYLAFVTKFTLRRIAAKQLGHLSPQQQLAQIQLHCYHINGMLGLVRWFTDFVAHLTKEIFLATVQPGAIDDPVAKVDPKTDPSVLYLSKNPSSFINVLLSKIMRWLLLFIIRGIKGIETFLVHMMNQEKALNSSFGLAMLTHKKFTSIASSGTVSIKGFDGVLQEVDKQLQALYTNDKIQDRVKQALELELAKNSPTPPIILPVVLHIIKLSKARLFDSLNIPNLYFYDTSWLMLDEPQQKINRDKVDTIKKFVISSNAPLRACTRCGQLSAIESAKQVQLNQVGSLFLRHCLCGGLWHDVPQG